MGWTVTIVLFLAICVALGSTLKCMQCTGFSNTPCTGSLLDCPFPSDVCGTTVIRTRGYRWTSFYYIRSCVSVTECFNNASVTGLYATTASETTCCFTNNCTTSIPTLPVENYSLNGLTCPSYVVTNMEPCDIKNVSSCTGNQTRCVRYSASTTLGSVKSTLYLGGCATENTCAMQSTSIYGDGIGVEIKRKCYNSAGSLHYSTISYSLPMILGLIGFYISM
ncbi:phospholipase A2 inhibitor and Ly6/PLAUR domain-containing protein-like isoform X1 [Hyla sarda]|uniref:phospholipase A2 inhibitor and Ly6/PLAUR domain-containing protein-like isoform X1 n=1 Tax=Hyla sarda TaxID=327740 RepID=UPI0024C30F18|nr:phospholipase A2 inhibitor and Ly6/PLAUR domain-containing protein-like isoform X1 [Hyla sarda]